MELLYHLLMYLVMWLHCNTAFLHVLSDIPHISEAPVLMLRPRAWNMVENNMMVMQCFITSPHQSFYILFDVSLHPYQLVERSDSHVKFFFVRSMGSRFLVLSLILDS